MHRAEKGGRKFVSLHTFTQLVSTGFNSNAANLNPASPRVVLRSVRIKADGDVNARAALNY